MGFNGIYKALFHFTRYNWLWQNFTGMCWVYLVILTGFYKKELDANGLDCFCFENLLLNEMYLVLPGFTGFEADFNRFSIDFFIQCSPKFRIDSVPKRKSNMAFDRTTCEWAISFGHISSDFCLILPRFCCSAVVTWLTFRSTNRWANEWSRATIDRSGHFRWFFFFLSFFFHFELRPTLPPDATPLYPPPRPPSPRRGFDQPAYLLNFTASLPSFCIHLFEKERGSPVFESLDAAAFHFLSWSINVTFPGFTQFYFFHTRFYFFWKFFTSSDGFCVVLLGFAWFCVVLLGFTGFYWV